MIGKADNAAGRGRMIKIQGEALKRRKWWVRRYTMVHRIRCSFHCGVGNWLPVWYILTCSHEFDCQVLFLLGHPAAGFRSRPHFLPGVPAVSSRLVTPRRSGNEARLMFVKFAVSSGCICHVKAADYWRKTNMQWPIHEEKISSSIISWITWWLQAKYNIAYYGRLHWVWRFFLR